MPSTDIRIRRARRKDLLPAARLLVRTFNRLRADTGKEPLPFRPATVPPLCDHIRRTDPDLFLCAWRGERMAGFASAVVRGKQWYLAWLFVDPRYQDRGVGKMLLERVWRDGPGMTHALATMTYNQQAVGIYTRFGMIPHELITMMEGERGRVRAPEPTRLEIERRLRPADLAWIHSLETEIRGYPHRSEWRFWMGEEGYEPLLFRRRGRPVAYGLLCPRGIIGPIGAARPADLVPAAAEAVRIHLETKKEDLRFFAPNSNGDLYRFLHRLGFRNQEMLLFMTDTPYGDFRRYVPASLAVF
ncbi:MAG: GNAT family N-acetyltransferase [Candidatus Eisenbacteria bacterium]